MNLIRKFSRVFFILFFISFSPFVSSSVAAPTGDSGSTDNNTIVAVMCNVINLLSGGIAKTIMILVIIFSCLMAFFGKMNMPLLVIIVVAMAVLIGAPQVVSMLTNISGKSASIKDICAQFTS